MDSGNGNSNGNDISIDTATAMAAPAPARRKPGFQPGISGNPAGSLAGRPQISLVATLRRKVEARADRKRKSGIPVSNQRVADEIVEEWIDLALNCKVAKVKLAAIVSIIDRLEGKPVTPVAIAPAELELVQRVRLAYDAVIRFAAANDLEMTQTEAVAWVAAREPRAREILSEFITIDITAEPAPADADAAAPADGAADAPAAAAGPAPAAADVDAPAYD